MACDAHFYRALGVKSAARRGIHVAFRIAFLCILIMYPRGNAMKLSRLIRLLINDINNLFYIYKEIHVVSHFYAG